MCADCFQRAFGAFEAKQKPLSSAVQQQAMQTENKPIAAHFSVIQLLNLALIKTLPFIDLSQENPVPGSLTSLVLSHRGLIFELVKSDPLNNAITTTEASGSPFDLRLSRSRAVKFQRMSTGPDHDARWTVFGQAFRALHGMNPKSLRRKDKLYNAHFMGEFSQDAGGPYR